MSRPDGPTDPLALLRAFMDHSPTPAWVKDAAGRYVYLSRPSERRFGLRSAECAGKTDADLWPAEVARQFRANDEQALAENRTVVAVETTHDPDGTETRWWVFKFPFTDAAGRRYVGGIAVDVTERERVKDELRRANDELRTALDQLRRLEQSLVTMCAWTRTVRMDGRWVPVEEFLREKFGVRVSHGISDEALRQMQAESDPGPKE